MKIKLLKKIRKRYSIIYYPNGKYFWSGFFDKPVTVLDDRTDKWRWKASDKPKEDARKELYEKLVQWIREDYSHLRKNKITEEKLWWK